MVRVFLFVLCMLLSSVTWGQGKKYVLVTGVSNYGNADLNLSQSTNDAKAFAKMMESQTPNIILLTSSFASKENVLEKFKMICERATEQDQVYFYYSGHGADGFLLTYGGFMSFDDLMEVAATCKAKDKVFFLDACHSGSVSNPGKNIFLVSCRPEEVSRENNMVAAGFFTRALLKGIRGMSDENKDRQINLIELFKYVYADVVRRSSGQQHPQLIAPKESHNSVIAEWSGTVESTEPTE